MLASIAIVFPIFALIALGYGVRRARLVDDGLGETLSRFVFIMAIPGAAFLHALALRSAGCAALGLLGGLISSRSPWSGRLPISPRASFSPTSHAGAVVAGFTAGQANLVLIGIPLVLSAYGEAGSGSAVSAHRHPSAHHS